MKIEVEHKRLLQLLNDSQKLTFLENGGVDNWEWYAESLDEYKKESDISKFGFNISKELKYSKNDRVYYNNNEALFVSYLTEDVAVIIVQAYPNFDDISGSQWCHPCNVGGTSTHTCEMAQEVIDVLEENSDPTNIPLLVSTKMLYDKPLIVNKHEEKVKELEDKKKEIVERTKELSMLNIELTSKNKELEEKIKKLEELSKF